MLYYGPKELGPESKEAAGIAQNEAYYYIMIYYVKL